MTKINDIFRKLIRPQEHSLKLQSMRAAFWSILGKGGSHVVRMAGSLILTRILFPEAFGLMATATVVLNMIQLFADTGVRAAIIQNPRGGEREFLNTAWIISICRGGLLFLIVTGLSWPMAYFYNQPDLKGLLFVMAFSPLLLGFENPALALFIKKFRVEKQVAFELGTQILGLITSIILSYIYRSVYALAFGTSISAVYRVAGSYMIQNFRPGFRWNRELGREIFNFGKYIMLNTMITWAATNVDLMMIGKLLDMQQLGFYSLGRNIGLMVSMLCYKIISQSYMPAVSSVADDISRVTRIYRRTQSFFLMLAVPVSVVLALFSQEVIQILYDPRYQAAAVAIFWISFCGIFEVIRHVGGYTFIAVGKPIYETVSMGTGLVCVLFFIPLGAAHAGLSGAAAGMFAAAGVIALTESLLLVFKLGFPVKTVLRTWMQAIVVAGGIGGSFYLLNPYLHSEFMFNLPFLAVMGLLSLAISGVVYRLLEGPHPFQDKS